MNTEKFLEIVDSTPLVSIDIILQNCAEEVLLGRRLNRPAKGYWFVPGGRIRKNETLKDAMLRISSVELGFEIALEDTELLGAYDHIYEDNFSAKEGVNTHYVALGHKASMHKGQSIDFDSQHSEIRWWSVSELMESELVHENTKKYFAGG
ncbi:MAG: GDP-mannose mannosyl hydrolase [Pseudomonadales bacterium]|nr:GDP-mannose mannosyl hydrolase [Pseudomonadales bacterium]